MEETKILTEQEIEVLANDSIQDKCFDGVFEELIEDGGVFNVYEENE